MNPQDCLLRCHYCRFCEEFEVELKDNRVGERGKERREEGTRRKEEGNCVSEGREESEN